MIKQIKHRPKTSKNGPQASQKTRQPLFQKVQHQILSNTKQSNRVQNIDDDENHSEDFQVQDKENLISKQYMKTIVSLNQDYFKEKLRVKTNGKPNKLRLFIPTRNNRTTYKTDYLRKSANTKSLKPHQLDNFNKNINLWTKSGTTYMCDYTGARNSQKPRQTKMKTSIDKNAPFFLDSSYSHNFLNWNGQNNIISMKPTNIPATTNIAFSSKTSYQNEFCQVKNKKNKTNRIFTNTQSGIFNTKNKVQIPYMTTSRVQFSMKKTKRQQNCKPKIHILGVNPNKFKGKTQYQNQFHETKTANITLNKQDEMQLSQLQNFMVSP